MDEDKARLRLQAETIRQLRIMLTDIKACCAKDTKWRRDKGCEESRTVTSIIDICKHGDRALIRYMAESTKLRLDVPAGQMRLREMEGRTP